MEAPMSETSENMIEEQDQQLEPDTDERAQDALDQSVGHPMKDHDKT